MQVAREAANLKWRVISHYRTQINCVPSGGAYHYSCGYMHAFVKHDEIFWTHSYHGGDAIPPATPASPTATPLNGAVRLYLSPLNSDPDLDAYSLQRRRSGDPDWTTVATGIRAWPYTDATVTNGTSYDYRVVAVDHASNESPPSGAVSATPVAPPVVIPPVPIVAIPAKTDLIAPRFTFPSPHRLAIATLRSAGITVRVHCSEACTITGRLELLVTSAASGGHWRTTVHLLGHSRTHSLPGAGTVTVRVRPDRARRRLLAHRRGRVRFTVVGHDPAGNAARTVRRLEIFA